MINACFVGMWVCMYTAYIEQCHHAFALTCSLCIDVCGIIDIERAETLSSTAPQCLYFD